MRLFVMLALALFPIVSIANIDRDETGGWYMYFYNTTFKSSSFGFQGDIQYRSWNTGGDLEQLLIRSGVTYKPNDQNIKFTLGYGNITNGTYGESDATTSENRIYQEALFPLQFGNRIYTNHRFRYEQRFLENQDFRTRYRYNVFLNIPLNEAELTKKTLYIAFYNEIFFNGQGSIGNDKEVKIFDRNRFNTALGYIIKEGLAMQLGLMNQRTYNWAENQIQLSLHHVF